MNQFAIYFLSSNVSSYSGDQAYALYVDDGGINRRFGTSVSSGYFQINSINNNNTAFGDNFSNDYYSYLLVSDGGLTNQSIANPDLNNANPNSPYNTPGPLSLAGFRFFALGYARYKQVKAS